MRFQCVHCLGVVSIDDADAGQAVGCGHCGGVIMVPPTRLSPGAVLSDFVLKKELGKGGMATVYLAHQLSLDRPAALKILHPHFAQDQAFISDFIQEARAAAKLNHPNIVQAYAVGEEEGTFFFAMEYVEGSTLKQVLTHSGRIVTDRALDIVREVTAGLDFAWNNQQLVHRDIKPDNIILHEQGRVKLADLGLARPVSDLLNESQGSVMGTPEYISPERLQGQVADNRCDIYSLGATLYHALTGRLPYTGSSPAEIARRHLTDPLTPPRQLVPDLREDVSALVEIMMSKRPYHRYGSAAELAVELERLGQGLPLSRGAHPDAQQPVSPDEFLGAVAPADEGVPPAPAPAAATPPTLVMPTGGPGLGMDADTIVEPLGPTPGEAAPGDAQTEGRSRRLPVVVAAIAAVVFLVVVSAAAWVYLTKPKDVDGQQAQEQQEAAVPPEQLAAQVAIRRLARDSSAAGEALRAVAEYRIEFPEADPLPEDIRNAVQPLVEKEVRTLRNASHEEELAGWRERAEQLKKEDLAAKEEEEKRRAAQEGERRKQAEAERAERERGAKVAKLEQEKQELRDQAIELCRQDKYDEARLLFMPMADSEQEAFRTWALMKQRSLELAEQAYALVHNSKEALAGQPFRLPGRSPGKISRISRRSISITYTKKEYDGGKVIGEVVTDRVEVPLADVRETDMWTLCKAAWSKEHDNDAELNLVFGAYLLARGRYISVSRGKLTASGKVSEVEPLLDELAVVGEAEWAKDWPRFRSKLELLVESGDRAGVGRLLQALRQHYPEHFKKNQEEIRELLQEN